MLTAAVLSCCLSGTLRYRPLQFSLVCLVHSRTDHCSSVLAGLPQSLVAIYRVRYCAARPVVPSPPRHTHWLPVPSILTPLAARPLNTHTTGCPSPQYSHHWLLVPSILTPLAARPLNTHTTGCPSPQYSHHWLPVTSILIPLAAHKSCFHNEFHIQMLTSS